jgi:hypothetical protein
VSLRAVGRTRENACRSLLGLHEPEPKQAKDGRWYCVRCAAQTLARTRAERAGREQRYRDLRRVRELRAARRGACLVAEAERVIAHTLELQARPQCTHPGCSAPALAGTPRPRCQEHAVCVSCGTPSLLTWCTSCWRWKEGE